MLPRELRGYDVQQYTVQLMSCLFRKAGEIVSNIFLELERRCRIPGGKTREAH